MKIKSLNSLFAIALAAVAVLGMASCNEKKFHVNGTIGNAADGCAGLVAECGEGCRGCGYSIYVECRFHIYIK